MYNILCAMYNILCAMYKLGNKQNGRGIDEMDQASGLQRLFYKIELGLYLGEHALHTHTTMCSELQ